MNYAVIGGDMRFAHLARMLEESGRGGRAFFQEKAGTKRRALEELKKNSVIISNWPMSFSLTESAPACEEIMENIACGSVLLLCGPKFPEEKRWDLQYENLWADEKLLVENAWLTAEGAVASAMRVGKISLRGAKCAVIGYGRIGQAITEILTNLGAGVSVISRSAAKRAQIRQNGANAFASEDIHCALQGQSFIFSTPPVPVLGWEELRSADPNARIIDLASPPYGVDLEAARQLNLQAWREPGLPGRYCPLSAAHILYQAVLRWEEAEKHV